MRIYIRYAGDNMVVTSETEIMNYFWPLWKEKMIARGKYILVSSENCLEDWKINHYAFEVPDKLLKSLADLSKGLTIDAEQLKMLNNIHLACLEKLTDSGKDVLRLLEKED